MQSIDHSISPHYVDERARGKGIEHGGFDHVPTPVINVPNPDGSPRSLLLCGLRKARVLGHLDSKP